MKKSLATVKIVSEIDIYEKNYGLYVFCVLNVFFLCAVCIFYCNMKCIPIPTKLRLGKKVKLMYSWKDISWRAYDLVGHALRIWDPKKEKINVEIDLTQKSCKFGQRLVLQASSCFISSAAWLQWYDTVCLGGLVSGLVH